MKLCYVVKRMVEKANENYYYYYNNLVNNIHIY